MIKFWFYLVVLLFLAILGLAVGAANDSQIFFDFFFVKKEISVATVLVIGVIFGFILGVWACLLMCLKYWFKAKKANVSLNKALKKNQQSVQVQENKE